MEIRKAYQIIRRVLRKKRHESEWNWSHDLEDAILPGPDFNQEAYDMLPEELKAASDVLSRAAWAHHAAQEHTNCVPKASDADIVVGGQRTMNWPPKMADIRHAVADALIKEHIGSAPRVTRELDELAALYWRDGNRRAFLQGLRAI